MKNIHILPTKNKSSFAKCIKNNVYEEQIGNLVITGKHTTVLKSNDIWEFQHLYITSDKEIKKGDWFIATDTNEIYKSDWIKFHFDNGKKIILTTDQDLIKDGVQPIDNEFLEWFVKNPNCEKVEVVKDKKLSSKNIYDAIEGDLVYSHRGYGGIINNLSNDVRVGIDNYIETAITSETGWETLDINNYQIYDKCYKIIIPKQETKQIKCYCGHTNYCDCSPLEEPKQETLEEAAKRYAEEYKGEDQDPWFDFMEGAKWQQERSYSEEEVLKIINLSREICSIDGNINLDDNNLQGNLEGFSMKYTIEQIFEQFKKKQAKH